MFFGLIHVVTAAMAMLMAAVPMTESLLCYQCATTDPNGDCITDYEGLINSSTIQMEGKEIVDNIYSKDCTADKPSWNRCMIETREQDGKIKSFHRGCHDGRTFGSNNNIRFHNINPTNHTVCAHVNSAITCYRFCDTDFCNGPQKPPNKTDYCKLYGPYYSDPSNNVTCGVGGVYFDSGPIRNPGLLVGVVTVVFIAFIGCRS